MKQKPDFQKNGLHISIDCVDNGFIFKTIHYEKLDHPTLKSLEVYTDYRDILRRVCENIIGEKDGDKIKKIVKKVYD